MDETTVQVLKEPGRAATSKSYMWVRRGGPPSRPLILFDYDPSRSGAVPFRLLADFKGTLQTDGYEGYAATAARDDIIHVGCLAHARRKFDEAVKAQAKTGRGGLKLSDGTGRAIRTVTHADPLAAEYLDQLTRAPVEQAIGRARGVRASPERAPLIVDFSNVVTSLSYDAVIHWGALAQLNEFDILAHGVGLLTSRPSDWCNIAPEFFGEIKQAKLVFDDRRVSFQHEGGLSWP